MFKHKVLVQKLRVHSEVHNFKASDHNIYQQKPGDLVRSKFIRVETKGSSKTNSEHLELLQRRRDPSESCDWF